MEDYNRIAPDVELGADVKLSCFINAYGCRIGCRTKVGSFVEIQKGVIIGADCKISSHTFICEGVDIGDGCMVAHNVTFINDKYPAAVNPDGTMQTEADWEVVPTRVGKGVSIGSSATILCGVIIGDGAMIGAGSVVTKDVPAGELWVGNPARYLKKVSEIS